VIKADRYDPLLNRAYAEMAEHYGCLVDPARAVKPKDKPRVERMMPYVRDSFWRGRSFASPADMQARALSWCTQVAGVRSHRGLSGASPLSVFHAVEAPELLALPDRAFELARWVSPKVAPDCHVMIDNAFYKRSRVKQYFKDGRARRIETLAAVSGIAGDRLARRVLRWRSAWGARTPTRSPAQAPTELPRLPPGRRSSTPRSSTPRARGHRTLASVGG